MSPDDHASELRRRLWNDPRGPVPPRDRHVPYDEAVLQQYKLYVEMADRVSQRRALANTFFLSLNTAIVTLVGSLWTGQPPPSRPWWTLIPALALLGQCVAWYALVRSYRQLNTAKYRVVGALEERLPASPYWRAEWWALGEGRHPRWYWPLSHIEQWVPALFGLTYLAGLVTVIAGAG